MIKKLSKLAVSRPWLVIITFILVTVFFALELPKLEIDTALKSQIPENMSSRINLNMIEDIFGGTEIILLNVKTDDIINKNTLSRIKALTDKLELAPGIEKVNSLFTVSDIRGENNSLIIEDIVTEIPENSQEKREIKNRIINNDDIYGTLVSRDFTSTSLVLVLEDGAVDDIVTKSIDDIVNSTPGKETIYKSGLPIIRSVMDDYIINDIRKFLPLGILIMLIFLYFCFKQMRGILLPFTVVIMSIIVAFGVVPLFGWKVQMITIILPVILLAVANDYGIHIIARYQEENIPGNKKTEKEISENVTRSLSKPILATGITTMVGLLCLKAHIIIPARQLGVLAAIGTGFALLASILFIPAVLTVLPKAKPLQKNHFSIERLLNGIANLVTGHPRKILFISLFIVIFSATGLTKLLVDTNPINYFRNDNEIVKADQLSRKEFGGSNTISLVAEGDILDPVVMKKIAQIAEKMESDDRISTVTSISTILSKINEVLHNGDNTYYRVPESREAIEQYLMLYSMSADTDKIIDFNHQYALINARIRSNSSTEITKIVENIKRDSTEIKESPVKIIGGFADLLAQLVDSVVKGQIYSLSLSLIIVTLILILLFRSVTAGFLSAVPLAISIIILFGLMGYLGIELNMVTTLLSSIMIGAGIDYTIHFLWRYREEKKEYQSEEAVRRTLLTTGRGIIFNALSVIIGFIVLLFSNFLPVSFFGFLVVISISTCLLGALFILPAICLITEPEFVEAK